MFQILESTIGSVLTQMHWDNNGGDMMGWGGGWWMWLWGVIVMGAIAAAGIGFLIWALRTTSKRPQDPEVQRSPGQKAKEILAERYARGEIDRDEYQERLQGLQ